MKPCAWRVAVEWSPPRQLRNRIDKKYSFLDQRSMQRVKNVRTPSVLLLSCAWALGPFQLQVVAAQSSADPVIYLDQGWSKDLRESYYHMSQGSTVLPYDIFLNLEV